MAKFYVVASLFPMGEPWGEGEFKNQSYWCQVEDLDEAVKINKQTRFPLNVGDQVYGNLIPDETGKPFLSGKGKPFFKFKSEKVPEGTARPQRTPNSSEAMPGWFIPVATQIEYIYKELKKNEPASHDTPDIDLSGVLDED